MEEIRLMLPAKRTARPRWELTRDGKVIGWVQEKRVASSVVTFYEALVIHPNGHTYSLELSGDFDERVKVVRSFQDDPARFNHHLPPEARL